MKAASMILSLFIGVLGNSVVAQEPAEQKPPERSPDLAKPTDPSEPPSDTPTLRVPDRGRAGFQPARRPGTGRKATEDRRLAALARLKEMMFEKIKFSPEKRTRLNSIFDNYMAGLLTNTDHPHLQPNPKDRSTPDELPELEKQLADAESAGASSETIAQIKNKIYAAKIVLEPNILDEPTFFLDYLSAEMSDEERSAMDPILERWRMLRVPEIAPDDEFKQLRRATRDPLIRESEELARKLDEIIIDAIRTVPLGPQRLDPKVMKGLAEKTKPTVMEVLSPSQREQFEETLRLVRQWSETDVELAEKERKRLKDYKPVEIPYHAKDGSHAPTKP